MTPATGGTDRDIQDHIRTYDGGVTAIRQTTGLLRRPATLRRLALASLIGNVVIVITGGVVRLTGSGLGCPTWPRCSADSYTTKSALGIHGVIEFGNRTLTFMVAVLALLALVSAWMQRPRRRGPVWWGLLVLLGIPAQAVLGGITVLTHLNPWVVALHFLSSIGLVVTAAYWMWARSRESDAAPHWLVPAPLRTLLYLVVGAAGIVVVVGSVVTGSGPHAGDAHAHRTGLNPGSVAQLHADLVFLLLGLTVAAWLAVRALIAARAATRAGTPDGVLRDPALDRAAAGPTLDGAGTPPDLDGAAAAVTPVLDAAGASMAQARVARAAALLLVVELAQGVIGFVQYFTHLPAVLVALHMGGACAVWVAALALLHSARHRPPVADTSAQHAAVQPDVATALSP